jgi:hypothetical protein
MSPQKDESKEEFLKRIAEELGEHFDVVQIFAQTDTPEETKPFSAGYGNMFARAKQVEMFLNKFDDYQLMFDPDEDILDDDDEDDRGEDWKDSD